MSRNIESQYQVPSEPPAYDVPSAWVGWIIFARTRVILLGASRAIHRLAALFKDNYYVQRLRSFQKSQRWWKGLAQRREPPASRPAAQGLPRKAAWRLAGRLDLNRSPQVRTCRHDQAVEVGAPTTTPDPRRHHYRGCADVRRGCRESARTIEHSPSNDSRWFP